MSVRLTCIWASHVDVVAECFEHFCNIRGREMHPDVVHVGVYSFCVGTLQMCFPRLIGMRVVPADVVAGVGLKAGQLERSFSGYFLAGVFVGVICQTFWCSRECNQCVYY